MRESRSADGQSPTPFESDTATTARNDDDGNTNDNEELMGEGVTIGKRPEPDPIRERHGHSGRRMVQAVTRARTTARNGDDDNTTTRKTNQLSDG